MKRNSILLGVIFTIISFGAISQSVEVDWGMEQNIEKGTFIQKVIGSDSEQFFTLRTEGVNGFEGGKIFLEKYDLATKEVNSSAELVLPMVNGNEAKFLDMYYFKGKLILFTEVMEHTIMRRNLYVQYMNEDGTIKNKPLKMGSLPASNLPEDGFTVQLYPKESLFLIVYNSSFESYAGEAFSTKLMDENLTEKWSKDLAFPLSETKFKVTQYLLGPSGNVYFVVDCEKKVTKGRTELISKEPVIIVYNSIRKEINDYNIEMKKYIPKEIKINLDKNENIVIFGSLSAKNTNTIEGYFFQRINPKTQTIEFGTAEKNNFIAFSKNKVDVFAGKRYEKLGANKFDFVMKEVIVLENGISFLLVENYFTEIKEIIDPKTKEKTEIVYSNYNDLMVLMANENGNMATLQYPVRVVGKSQYGINDFGYWSSYYATASGSKMKIIFNDANGNKDIYNDKLSTFKTNVVTYPKGSAYVVTVYSDGSAEKDELFTENYSKYITSPKLVAPYKDGFIIYGQEKSKYKFGTFFFE
ncbi:MAG: hypothetical protein JXR58_11065 [Bacteroidales bacterium]|nr:hypothetical protein [Bacteroidales bacterium]